MILRQSPQRPWPLTLKINRVHPLPMGNICGRFAVSMIITLSSMLFTMILSLSPQWPWPLTLKINRVHPLPMGNICGRFDVSMMTALSSMLFTRILCLNMPKSTVTLTFDPWPWKSIGFILSPWGTFVEGLMFLWSLLCLPCCSQESRHTHRGTTVVQQSCEGIIKE